LFYLDTVIKKEEREKKLGFYLEGPGETLKHGDQKIDVITLQLKRTVDWKYAGQPTEDILQES
jgi:hypothetical protein